MIVPITALAVDSATRSIHEEFKREAIPHMDLLYNYALRMTADPDDAKDLLQETYLGNIVHSELGHVDALLIASAGTLQRDIIDEGLSGDNHSCCMCGGVAGNSFQL
jgi:hypothetical protein